MTREEAIIILEEEAEFLYGGDEPYNKIAFDMAIEALKAEPKCIAQIKVDTEEIVRRIKEEYMLDESANAEDRLYIKIYADDEPSVKAEKLYQICGETQNKEVAEWLKEYFPLSNDNWIPVSERLPSESGDYLCTIPLDADETYTEVLTFHKGRFYEDDDEWGATYHDDVLAWMPLPTPYKESEVEE